MHAGLNSFSHEHDSDSSAVFGNVARSMYQGIETGICKFNILTVILSFPGYSLWRR